MKSRLMPFILPFLVCACSLDAQVTTLPAGSVVAGLTLEEWTAKWWQWQLILPWTRSPNLDTNGTFAYGAQGGPVFFLAGGVAVTEGFHYFTRAVTIRSDKYVFFPINNSSG